MDYELYFLKSLIITISIETVVLISLVKILYRKIKIQTWILIIAGITASLATLPYLWFILPMFLKTKVYYHIVSELTAVSIETFIIMGFLRTNLLKALILSVGCNLISYLIGLIIF
jgi:hypothetical protein